MPRTRATDHSAELRKAISRASMTIGDAADLIGVKRGTMYHWLAAGEPNPAPKWALDLFKLKISHYRRAAPRR